MYIIRLTQALGHPSSRGWLGSSLTAEAKPIESMVAAQAANAAPGLPC
jgi:hypothetical protein